MGIVNGADVDSSRSEIDLAFATTGTLPPCSILTCTGIAAVMGCVPFPAVLPKLVLLRAKLIPEIVAPAVTVRTVASANDWVPG